VASPFLCPIVIVGITTTREDQVMHLYLNLGTFICLLIYIPYATGSADTVAPMQSWSDWGNVPGDYSSGQEVCDARARLIGSGVTLAFIADNSLLPSADGKCREVDALPTRPNLAYPFDGYYCPAGYDILGATYTRTIEGDSRIKGDTTICIRSGPDPEKSAGRSTCNTGADGIGNPINLSTGNKYLTEVDIPLLTAGGITFQRTYNSFREKGTDLFKEHKTRQGGDHAKDGQGHAAESSSSRGAART
jgi:hypothetical protein